MWIPCKLIHYFNFTDSSEFLHYYKYLFVLGKACQAAERPGLRNNKNKSLQQNLNITQDHKNNLEHKQIPKNDNSTYRDAGCHACTQGWRKL